MLELPPRHRQRSPLVAHGLKVEDDPGPDDGAPEPHLELAEAWPLELALERIVAGGVGFEEAVWLLEGAYWDEDKHPRWPAGTPGGLGGKFMKVGQRFELNGVEYDVEAVLPGKIHARVATKGASAGAKTVMIDADTLSKAKRPQAETIVAATPTTIKATKKAGTATVIDPYADPSTHDPSIPIPEAAAGHITPEDWKLFGKLDQEKYSQVMERFGKWSPGVAEKHVNAVLAKCDSESVQGVKHAISSQKGKSTGLTLSAHSVFGAIKAAVKGTSQAETLRTKYEGIKYAQSEAAAALQWDLYNRTKAPDIAIFHKHSDTALFQNQILGGDTPVFSGLSQSGHWRQGWWSNTTFATPMAIRHIVMSTTSANIAGSFSGHGQHDEKEIAVADPYFATPDKSANWSDSTISSSQAKWLESQTKVAGGGEVLAKFIAAIKGGEMLPVPPAPPELAMDNAGGKLYVAPPPAALVADSSGLKVTEMSFGTEPVVDLQGTEYPAGKVLPANQLGLKPGDYIQGKKEDFSTDGTKYLILKDPSDQYMGLAYMKLTEPDGVTPYTGTTEVHHFTGGGTSGFKKLSGHYEGIEVQKEQAGFNAEAWAETQEMKFIQTFAAGEKFYLHGNPYEIVQVTGSSAKVKSLVSGELGQLNGDYKSPWLVLKEGFTEAGLPSVPPPQVGDTLAYEGKKATVTKLLKGGGIQINLAPGVVKLMEGDPALEGLFSGANHELGEKSKLKTLAPGQKFHGGTGGAVRPYVVVEQKGKTTLVRNLDTGAESEMSSNKSFAPLHPKAAGAPAPDSDASTKAEPGAAVQWNPDGWEMATGLGASVPIGQLQVGDKLSKGGESWEIVSLDGPGTVKNLATGATIDIGANNMHLPVTKLVPKGQGATIPNVLDKNGDAISVGDTVLALDGKHHVVSGFTEGGDGIAFEGGGAVFANTVTKAKTQADYKPRPVGELLVGDTFLHGGAVLTVQYAYTEYATAVDSSGKSFNLPNGIEVVPVPKPSGMAEPEPVELVVGQDYAFKQLPLGAKFRPSYDPGGAILTKAGPDSWTTGSGKPMSNADIADSDFQYTLVELPAPLQGGPTEPGAPGWLPNEDKLPVKALFPGDRFVWSTSVFEVTVKGGATGTPQVAKVLPDGTLEDPGGFGSKDWEPVQVWFKPAVAEPAAAESPFVPSGEKLLTDLEVGDYYLNQVAGWEELEMVFQVVSKSPSGEITNKQVWPTEQPVGPAFMPGEKSTAQVFTKLADVPEFDGDLEDDVPPNAVPPYSYDPSAYVPTSFPVELGSASVGDIFVGATNGKHYLITKTGAKSGLTALDLMTGKTSTPWKYEKKAIVLRPKATNQTPYEQLTAGDPVLIGELHPGDHIEIGGSTYEIAVGQDLDDQEPKVSVHPVLPSGDLGPVGTADTWPLAVVTFKAKAADVQTQKEAALASAAAPLDPASLPQAPITPFSPKSKTGGGYVFTKVKHAAEGTLLQDKTGAVYKVKVAGANVVLSDGTQLVTTHGDENLKVVEVPFEDNAPAAPATFAEHVQVGAKLMQEPAGGEAPWTVGELSVGDLFELENAASTWKGTWVVSSSLESIITATKLGTAKTKAFPAGMKLASWKPASAAKKHGEPVVPAMLEPGDAFTSLATQPGSYYEVMQKTPAATGTELTLKFHPPGGLPPQDLVPVVYEDITGGSSDWKFYDISPAPDGTAVVLADDEVQAKVANVGDKIAWQYGVWDLTGTVTEKHPSGAVVVDVDPGDYGGADFSVPFGIPPHFPVTIQQPPEPSELEQDISALNVPEGDDEKIAALLEMTWGELDELLSEGDIEDAAHQALDEILGEDAAAKLPDEKYQAALAAAKGAESWERFVSAIRDSLEGPAAAPATPKVGDLIQKKEFSDVSEPAVWKVINIEFDGLLNLQLVKPATGVDKPMPVGSTHDITPEVYADQFEPSSLATEPVFKLPETKPWSKFKDGDDAWTLGGKHGVVNTAGLVLDDGTFLDDVASLYVADPFGEPVPAPSSGESVSEPLAPAAEMVEDGMATFGEVPEGAYFKSLTGTTFWKTGTDEAVNVETGKVTSGVVASMPLTKLKEPAPAPSGAVVPELPEGFASNLDAETAAALGVGTVFQDSNGFVYEITAKAQEAGVGWKTKMVDGPASAIGTEAWVADDYVPTAVKPDEPKPETPFHGGPSLDEVQGSATGGLTPATDFQVGDVFKTPFGNYYEVMASTTSGSEWELRNLATGATTNINKADGAGTILVPPAGSQLSPGDSVPNVPALKPGMAYSVSSGNVYKVLDMRPSTSDVSLTSFKLELLDGPVGKAGEQFEIDYPTGMDTSLFTVVDSADYSAPSSVQGDALELGKWYTADDGGLPFEVVGDDGDVWWVSDEESEGFVTKDSETWFTELGGPPAPQGLDEPAFEQDPPLEQPPPDLPIAAGLQPFSPKSKDGGGYFFGKLVNLPIGTKFKDKSGAVFTKKGMSGGAVVYEDAHGQEAVGPADANVKLLGPLNQKAQATPEQLAQLEGAPHSEIMVWPSALDADGKLKNVRIADLLPGQKFKDAGGVTFTVVAHKTSGGPAVVYIQMPDGFVVSVSPTGYVRVL